MYGSLLAITTLAWRWQPYEFDVFPRVPDKPESRPDPAKVGLFDAGSRILIITAHPDDSELFAAGTLTLAGEKGIPIDQIICTDGDKGYYPFEDSARNRRVRRAEATEAKNAWKGRSLTFLGFPDGRLRTIGHLPDYLKFEVERIQPTHILCFDGKYPVRFSHGDHRYSGESVDSIASAVPSVKWVLHFQTGASNFWVDIGSVYDQKIAAMRLHRSQFTGSKLRGIENNISNMAAEEGDKSSQGLSEGFRATQISPH